MTQEKFGKITLINGDCMEYLRSLPDNAFSLACVDPPYSSANSNLERTGGAWAKKYGKKIKKWDIAPPDLYFAELKRVSENQIIWGANYFGNMPPTRCFLIWKKCIPENFSMAMCEYAWTSFSSNAKVFEHHQFGTAKEPRWHPTQKPIALYSWIFQNYAKDGDRILDTHLGSGSSAIAAHDLGFEFVGIEIDQEYYDKAKQRLIEHQRQLKLF